METNSRQMEYVIARNLQDQGVEHNVAYDIAHDAIYDVEMVGERDTQGDIVVTVKAFTPHPKAQGAWARTDLQLVEVKDDIGIIAGIVARPQVQPILA